MFKPRRRRLFGPLVLLFAILTTATAQPSYPRIPGVGFSLTPDYATAAIFFPNGSFVQVARIEGSPAYKSFMRSDSEPDGSRLESINPTSSSVRSSFFSKFRDEYLRILCPTLEATGLAFTNLGLPLCQKKPDFASAQALLRSLQSAVSAYLGTTFCYVGIVLPYPGESDIFLFQDHVISKAIKSIGLRKTHRTLNAVSLALWAERQYSAAYYHHHNQDKNSSSSFKPFTEPLAANSEPKMAEDPENSRPPYFSERPNAVLAIDFSLSAGLNAALLAEDDDTSDGLITIIRQEYYNNHNKLDWGSIESTLTKLTTSPSAEHDPWGTPLTDTIQKIVLLGDYITHVHPADLGTILPSSPRTPATADPDKDPNSTNPEDPENPAHKFLAILQRVLIQTGSDDPTLLPNALKRAAQQGPLSRKGASTGEMGSALPDPDFLPAVGMAMTSFSLMDDVDFDRHHAEKPAFMCRFWSALYE